MYRDDDQFETPSATSTREHQEHHFGLGESKVGLQRDVHKLQLNRGAEFTVKNPYTMSGRGKAGEITQILAHMKPQIPTLEA
jgi:hypothetical protein